MDDIFNNLAIKWDETLLGDAYGAAKESGGGIMNFVPFGALSSSINRQINIARVGIRAIEKDRLGRENRVI